MSTPPAMPSRAEVMAIAHQQRHELDRRLPDHGFAVHDQSRLIGIGARDRILMTPPLSFAQPEQDRHRGTPMPRGYTASRHRSP